MITNPNNEPSLFTAGDSIQWTKSVPDFPATAGNTLSYALINAANKIEFDAVQSGSDYQVSLPSSTTSGYEPGEYKWQSYITDNADNRTQVGEGTIKIVPNFADLTTYDARGHVKKVLDAIEAVIEGRATKDQQEYQIANRRLWLSPIADLILLRDKYRTEYKRMLNAERIKNGLGSKNKILVRF